jgi:hypothetical protein
MNIVRATENIVQNSPCRSCYAFTQKETASSSSRMKPALAYRILSKINPFQVS